MRIGGGDLKKAVSPKDYENPTMMEFVDLGHFLECYRAVQGRPETKWNDLVISHNASQTLLESPNAGNIYYAWFSDLKQWASDKNRKVIIKDKKGLEIELPPFLDVDENTLNPIEVYAYLLGLFINNMYNGIYLNYVLSFPVTYERKIRQKLLKSFSDGLKKSLPQPVLEDNASVNEFRVAEGASEPASYAVCALQEYGFAPQDNEKILYGIFDFGGGTTDFDFGTWERSPQKLRRRYDYIIRRFGEGGDRHLGGENILELLAYHVFQENQAVLRENNIQFIKPADCQAFDGSEALLSSSQQAKFNHRKMAEELRPLWEGEAYEKDSVKLLVYDINSEAKNIELKLNPAELKAVIRKRIDTGMKNFFEAMKKAVTEEVAVGVDKIHVFLAGNSSKSELVKESFAEFRKEYEPYFAKLLNIELPEITEAPAEPEKPKDYLVKKYSAELLAKFYDNAEIAEKNSNFQDDCFLKKLYAQDYIDFLEEIFDALNENTDELIQDMYKLWEEGMFPPERAYGILEYLSENIDDYSEEFAYTLINFIYNNKSLSDDTPEFIRETFDTSYIDDLPEIVENTSHPPKAQTKLPEIGIFALYPPLGTEEADNIRRQKGIAVSDAVSRPTGKTGVAYGLLECRIGSRIKVESNIEDTSEIRFNFYTGFNNCGKFEVITDRDIAYHEWVEFIDAGDPDFELYYTDLPEAESNQMPVSSVKRKLCRIDETMEDASVYIRAVEPSVLEFCATFGEEELKNQEYLSAPKKIILE